MVEIWTGQSQYITDFLRRSFADIKDSDLYDVIFHSPLLPTEHIEPASYPPGATRENEGKRASTVDDICDFIVEYINSDVLVCAFFPGPQCCFDPVLFSQGLLSNKHLVIAGEQPSSYFS